jgi:DNA-binding response OmpR family regulator
MDSLVAWSRRRLSPLTTDAVAESKSASLIPSPPAPCALIVETDTLARQLCRDVLERVGFVVVDAESGIAAVLSARASLPNLILVGLQLRDVPGPEAVEWLRSNPALHSTPLVVFIGGPGDEAKWSGTTGAVFLRKPLSTDRVLRVVEEVITQHYREGRP